MSQKKSFKTDIDPVMQFINAPADETVKPDIKPAASSEGRKPDPRYIETKSKRLQLLIQPSLLDKLKYKAKSEGRSVNDLVHSILEEKLK